jgi:hypothetical protein
MAVPRCQGSVALCEEEAVGRPRAEDDVHLVARTAGELGQVVEGGRATAAADQQQRATAQGVAAPERAAQP